MHEMLSLSISNLKVYCLAFLEYPICSANFPNRRWVHFCDHILTDTVGVPVSMFALTFILLLVVMFPPEDTVAPKTPDSEAMLGSTGIVNTVLHS